MCFDITHREETSIVYGKDSWVSREKSHDTELIPLVKLKKKREYPFKGTNQTVLFS